MAHHLVRCVWFLTIATALGLQGCGKSSPDSVEGQAQQPGPVATGTDLPASVTRRESKTSERPLASKPIPVAQRPADDPPSWLAELLQSPDPNVRIQALDVWARQPTASLDPVTYALVDPDESVRTRAQEVLEQELMRR